MELSAQYPQHLCDVNTMQKSSEENWVRSETFTNILDQITMEVNGHNIPTPPTQIPMSTLETKVLNTSSIAKITDWLIDGIHLSPVTMDLNTEVLLQNTGLGNQGRKACSCSCSRPPLPWHQWCPRKQRRPTQLDTGRVQRKWQDWHSLALVVSQLLGQWVALPSINHNSRSIYVLCV